MALLLIRIRLRARDLPPEQRKKGIRSQDCAANHIPHALLLLPADFGTHPLLRRSTFNGTERNLSLIRRIGCRKAETILLPHRRIGRKTGP